MKTLILVGVLLIVWVMLRSSRKRRMTEDNSQFGLARNTAAAWGKEHCSCGTPRDKWKPLAINRPENTLLLYCPQCLNLWEEAMSKYGNKWRPVDRSYAKESYDYDADLGGGQIGT